MTAHEESTPFVPAPGGPARWVTPAGVLIRHWSDADTGVVYDERHARTHLLSQGACEVLQRCRLEALSLPTLSANDDPEWMLATVTALEVAGLLSREPAPSSPVACPADESP